MNKDRLTKFNKENILQVADELFLKYGFEKTTIEMIAKAADYSKPTIYAYFPSKEDVFANNLAIQMDLYKDKLLKHIENKEMSILDIYLSCCRETVALQKNYPVYFNGIMGNLDYGNGNISEAMRRKISVLSVEINGYMRSLFVRAEKEGLIASGINLNSAYIYVWSCILGLAVSPNLARGKFESEESYNEVMDKFFMNVIETYLEK